MKRQISISIFLTIIVILLTFLYVKISNETKPKDYDIATEETEANEMNSITISQEYTNYKYYIKEADGRLVVYEIKTQEIFTETGIEIYTLPEEIKEKLETGIFFATEYELYDFLESYSS